MKTTPLILLVSFLVLASLLSACSGSASLATGWPGISVDKDTVYLAYNQHVFAIDLSNGTEKWRFPLKADPKLSFFAAPVITSDGQLIVSGYNNLLYSLNSQNGQENQGNWPFKGATNRYIASPLVTDQGIFAPTADNSLYALDPQGNFRWSFKTGHALWATPVTDGKNIYLSSMDRRVYALDAKSGALIWKTDDLGGAVVGSPTLSPDGILYVGTFAKEMLALNANNGSILWRFATSGWVWSAPVLDGKTLYFGDLKGTFYALNLDGQKKWQVPAELKTIRSVSGTPLVFQDKIYFTTEDGSVYGCNKATGNPCWNKSIGGKLYASPILAGDKILVASVGIDQILQALDPSGNPIWSFVPAKK